MEFGNVEPAHLYNESVLRKAKQLDMDEKLNLGKVKDPIISVLEMKYKAEFSGTVRKIGLDKFFLLLPTVERLNYSIQSLKIDIAHLIKAACRWKCFKDKHARIKDFFVRYIGLLSQSTTFQTFKQICQDVLTVAFSETEDIETNDDIIFMLQCSTTIDKQNENTRFGI
ncbi:hypothetical protein PV326_004202 [Microctonus aethiopoides]|nr:hypothetical protein PV326_004202 [Microctonus aethiopoides]